jgi:hypothetical protein
MAIFASGLVVALIGCASAAPKNRCSLAFIVFLVNECNDDDWVADAHQNNEWGVGMDDVLVNHDNSTVSCQHWQIEDIDFSAANTEMRQQDPAILWLAIASSFIESASEVYTENLVEYFSTDPEISGWLKSHWEPEELQHGRALRAYVEAAWPSFDWPTAFSGFLEDYSKLCSVEILGPTRALELVSRCVIETGTSTLYRAIRDATTDPVLRKVADNIQRDEVRHFKHFFSFFRRYQDSRGASRWAIAKMLMARVLEIRDSDAICALSHIRDGCANQRPLTGDMSYLMLPDATNMYRQITTRLRYHYPLNAAAKMLLAPLALPVITRKVTSGIVNAAARTSVVWSLLQRSNGNPRWDRVCSSNSKNEADIEAHKFLRVVNGAQEETNQGEAIINRT